MSQSRSKLRSTESYVYTMDDVVGKGASCEVFKGIHKDTGQIHALKVFDFKMKGVAKREIDALKSLKHENIVEFIKEDMDLESHRVVAVMEYCNKSLYNVLCEPENKHGLTEDEFLRFFKHTVEGMKHLREHEFLHRDIKPGNILLSQDDDGSYIYKLSDFGTAKPVMATEAFQSLVGTEEYLHPDIFRAAFFDQGMKRQFDASADLWSLGVTLYHAAVGKVPFQPFLGRNDRRMMFEMIAKKEFGVLAGEQRTQGGEITWTRELPSTCVMSRWLKLALTEVLSRLIESDPQKAMTFDTFFMAADDILSRKVMYIFSTTSAKHFRLYLPQDSVYADLQQGIYEETNIPAKHQLINYEECFLKDIVKETDTVASYPRLSLNTPLVMIRSTGVEQCTMPDESHFWYTEPLLEYAPNFSEDSFTLNDLHAAQDVCNTVAHVQQLIQHGCLTQELFEKTINRTERWKEILVHRLQTEVDLYRDRVKDLRHIHHAIMSNGGLQCLTPTNGLSMEDLKYKINNCSGYMKLIQGIQTDDGGLLYLTGCMDEGNKCQKKISRLLEQAKTIKSKFEDRKKKKTHSEPFHEKQLLKFDRKELLSLYDKAKRLWRGHCQGKLREIHNHFLDWHKTFAHLQTQFEALQREIYSTKLAIRKYNKNFKVGSEPSSRSSSTSLVSQMDNEDFKRRNLASSLINQLDQVKCEQEEMRTLVNQSEEIHLQSMELMSTESESMVILETRIDGGRPVN